MKKLEELFCWSLSVKDGDSVQVRESATLTDEAVPRLLEKLVGTDAENGMFYLGTCHRVEIYGFGVRADEALKGWLGERGIMLGEHRLRRGVDVLRHLIRVASSLESEVLGETQITGQVKDAADVSRKLGFLRGPLDRCVQVALRSAKRIRSETKLSEGTVSVAHVAVDGLADVFEGFENKNALVVGAGTMAKQALERMLDLGFARITWVNRTADRIATHTYGERVQTAAFEQIHELAWQHAVTVVATASPEVVIKHDRLISDRKKAVSGPRVLLDLGLPRNVDAKIRNYQGFLLRNVDEFRDGANRNSARRREALKTAEEILDLEIDNFVKVWNTWGRGPWIGELYKGLEFLQKQELGELGSNESKLADSKDIEYITRSIYAKLMHRLIEEIDSVDEPLGNQVLEILVRAWRQPEQWLQRSQHPPQKNPSKAK